jgi:hypothetical protein
MIQNNELQDEAVEEGSSKLIWLPAVSTGALFWASLFGLILFCLRA